jgi:uncharacterized membrane protein
MGQTLMGYGQMQQLVRFTAVFEPWALKLVGWVAAPLPHLFERETEPYVAS